MAVKLDSLGSSLNLALEHKQDTTTAVITNEANALAAANAAPSGTAAIWIAQY